MAAELLAPPLSDRRWEAALWVRPKGYRRVLTKDHCLMATQWVKASGSHSVHSKELAKGLRLVRLRGSERVRAKGTRMVQGSALG